MLSETLWRGSFGADPALIGSRLDIDGSPTEIIGVMPSGGPWALRGDIWRPLVPTQKNFLEQRGVHSLSVIARLAKDASVSQADQDMRAIASALETEYPEENVGRNVRVVGMHAFLLADIKRPLTMLGIAVGILLLLTCCNAAMLLLARSSAREAELGLRSSLGAGRMRLLNQLAAESLILALLGGVFGIALAYGTLQAMVALNPLPSLSPDQWRVDLPALGFSMLASMVAALLAGVVPALIYSRVEPARALGNSRGATSIGGETARRVLVSTQVAIAMALLLSVGVLLRSYVQMANVDPGLHGLGVATVSLDLPPSDYPMPPLDRYPQWPEVNRFMDAVLERARSIPGAESAALTQHAPLAPAWTTSLDIEGRQMPAGTHEEIQLNSFSPGTLATLGIPLRAGRDFDARDRADSVNVLLINEAAALRYFPGQDPIGRRIRFWSTWREVVGVVGDVRSDGLTEPAQPMLHAPLAQTPMSSMTLSVRTRGDPSLLLQSMRDAIWAVEPVAVPYDEGSVAQRLDHLLAPQQFAFGLTGFLALLAGLLALSGQIGLIVLEVQRRKSEIGVRVALGARPHHVLSTILNRSLRATAIGMALGLATFLLAAPVLDHFIYGIAARDALSSVSVVLIFFGTALIASAIPAWRALRLDPMQALRAE